MNFPGELRVVIREDFCSQNYNVWLIASGREPGAPTYMAEPAELVFKKRSDGDELRVLPEPWLRVSFHHMKDLFQGLSNELARLGFQPDSGPVEKLAGKLEATERHLLRESNNLDKIFNLLQDTVRLSLSPPPRDVIRGPERDATVEFFPERA